MPLIASDTDVMRPKTQDWGTAEYGKQKHLQILLTSFSPAAVSAFPYEHRGGDLGYRSASGCFPMSIRIPSDTALGHKDCSALHCMHAVGLDQL